MVFVLSLAHVSCSRYETRTSITEGNDFSIQSVTPGTHEIVIEYQSPSGPVEHGALVIELVDNWNRDWTLAVPILVQ